MKEGNMSTSSHMDVLSHRIHSAMSVETEVERANPFSKDMLMRMAMQMISQADPKGPKPKMVLPVDFTCDTKKNKARLINEDRSSPMGVVLKDDMVTSTFGVTTAVASFDAYQIFAWLCTLPE